MMSLEKLMILTSLQKLPNNVGDLGKIIVASSFEWLPKVQKIAQSCHTGWNSCKNIVTVLPTPSTAKAKLFFDLVWIPPEADD